MKKKFCLERALSLLIAAALVAGLASPALAVSDPGSGQGAGSSGSVAGAAYSENPDAYEIYPVPHSVDHPQGDPFTMTDTVNVVADGEIDTYTVDFLQEILTRFGFTMSKADAVDNGKTNIVLAIHGDDDPVSPTAVTGLFTAQDKYDPYILTADASENDHGVITIVGKNTDCVYYGLATLQMMFTSFNGEKFLPVRIEDYSNTIFRGFIEGFYGGFDYAGRESQIRSIRDVKGNMYVFASKTDPYHGENWSTLYPADELAQIKHLVDVGKEMKVNYTWSVHIGKGGALNNIDDGATIDEGLYSQRLASLKAKFQQLYDIGVRSFNVLNDDYNSGTYRVQVKLLNDINAWLKEKGDCMPLIYCCAGYNTSWAQGGYGGNGAELPALRGLDDDIYLYWTGADVNSPITQESVDYPNTQSGQSVVTWLNYPCSEHAKSGLFLGDISHYVKDADGLTGQCGILSNAINSPEANKVAYFQLLSWAWNRDSYTDYLTELWEDSFKYLQPEVYESYLTIARNVSNCPGSGRIPAGFPESEYLAEALAAVQQALLNGDRLANIQGAQGLLDEFDHILSAIADFRANCANSNLKTEMEPWLKSLEGVVTAGKNAALAADALTQDDVNTAWSAFSAASLGLAQWDANRSSNPNYDANVMAKAGSKRLQPFAGTLIEYVQERLLPLLSPDGGLGGEPTFYARMGGSAQTANAQSDKLFDGNPATYGHFTIVQQKDDYYGIDLGQVKLVTAVDILQGSGASADDHDYYHNAALECSADGKNWITLVSKVNSHHIHVEDLSAAARYVRLRLTETGYNGKPDYWTDVREFTVTTADADAGSLLYTSLEDTTALSADGDGGVYTLTAGGQVTLPAGGYVGLRLPEISSVAAVTLSGDLPAGLTLQHSPNGVVWTDGIPTAATPIRFIRLVNKSGAEVTGTLPTVTASQTITTKLSFVSDSGVSLSSGSWSNVVDGDRSTSAYTGVRQAFGQYAIFDLGGVQPVKDVTVVVPESGADVPHNLDIMVGSASDPNGTWTTIAQIRSSGDIDHITDDQYTIDPSDPTHRIFTCDGNGVTGRYIKLAIADIGSKNWFYINELEVNKTVPPQESVGALSGAAGGWQNAVDGNLSTFYAPSSEAGHLQYLLPELTRPTAVTVLQSPATISGAAVKAQKADGEWETLGVLDKGACTFEPDGGIVALRVEWAAGKAPAIAEIILVGAGSGAAEGTIPTLRPNIYEQPDAVADVTVPNGTAIGNVSLPDRVDVTDSAGNPVSAPVAWTCAAGYDGSTAGTYAFTGRFTESDTLFNPGCFTLTADVTVNPATSAGETAEQNLALERPVYASGREVDSQGPEKAVDENDSTLWSSNKMKQKDGTTEFPTIENAVSWITVDLGTDVSSITQVQMKYNAKVWPLEYYVQVGGSSISYDGYTTPSIDTEYSTTDIGNVTLSTSYAGDIHALNAAGWTTIYHGTRDAGNATNPIITLGDGGDAAFTEEIPTGTRYIRIYFTQINPNALAGTGIGLKELTVTGTRTAPAVDTNIASLAAVTATGTVGTAFDDLELPDTVVATLGDDSTVRVGVTWDGTDYDANATAQTFTGTVTLPGGVTNTTNVKASLTLTLTPAPTIASVQFTPASLSVANGTAFAALGLPTQGTATLSNGSTVAGTIDWAADSYNAAQAGAQTISGTFTAGGKNHDVSIQVTVAAPEVVKHTVTFRSEGSIYTTVKVIHSQTIGTLPTPTRDGYTFGGWFYGDPETRLTAGYVVNGGLTVTAKWTLNRYTVTFNTQGGSDVDAQTVDHGGKAAVPTAPTKDGYTFGGWYTSAACADSGKYDFDTAVVTRDITLYAKWTLNRYTVTFNTQGGSDVDAQTVDHGGKATVPTAPTRDGYTFGGWYTSAACADSGKYDFDTAVVIEDITLYAKWTENSSSGDIFIPTLPTNTPTTPDTTTTTTTNPDGTKTTTVTDTKTGTVTETTEKKDGTVETVETKKDGTVTETTKNTDGSSEVVETKPDGTVTAIATDTEGGKVEKVTTPEKDVTVTATDKDGEVLAKVEIPAEIPAPETRFEDVPEGHWADEAIHNMAALEIVSGVGGSTFDRNGDMKRGDLALVLSRMSNTTDKSYDLTFTDVPADKYYANGVAWAAKTGVVTGRGEETFAPENTITREELAVMLCRYARLLGMDTDVDSAALDGFADSGDTHAWAEEGMAWCVGKGILKGKGNGVLDPRTNVTRAEVAVMLQRFMDLVK